MSCLWVTELNCTGFLDKKLVTQNLPYRLLINSKSTMKLGYRLLINGKSTMKQIGGRVERGEY